MANNRYVCPICNGCKLTLKYESSFVYSYVIDSDEPGRKNSDAFISYLYDKREQTDNRRYVECNTCGTQYPYSFLNGVLNEVNHKVQLQHH